MKKPLFEHALLGAWLYHYMVNINGIPHRIIQWSDPKTIDMEQLQCGPWCDFVPGKPVTNFLHQIMLRDAVVNEAPAPSPTGLS